MTIPKEIEAKYALGDAEALRERLVAATAVRVGAVDQVDVFYDDGSGRYCEGGCGLRIRRTRPAGDPAAEEVRITFKGPLEQAGGLKVRDELETTLGDGVTADGILAALGFAPVVTVTKHRESWQLGGCQIEIDVVESAGQFVEVEGPTAESVRAVCDTLALCGEPITTSYAAMVAGN
ncbi:MAG: class IV adenylate cyclase [Phycisphaerales bacterium]|nr:class IV adenylate cyclase [Phycisphaerales bacterium]